MVLKVSLERKVKKEKVAEPDFPECKVQEDSQAQPDLRVLVVNQVNLD